MTPSILQYGVEAVVVFSLITLFAGMVYLVLSILRKRGAGIVKGLTVVTGILTAASTLLIKESGAQITPRDEARDTITTFYDHIEHKDFAQAFDWIHDARKAEMKQQGRTYEDFEKAYESTRDYRNFEIDFERAESPISRLYWVSFDVMDSFPENSLFEDNWRSSSNLIDAGCLNETKLVNTVMRDLARFYDLSENTTPKVREYVRNAPLYFIFQPSFIADVGNGLRLKRKPIIDGVNSWSHHIENLKLQSDNGWKIRSGLFPEVFSAPYPFGFGEPSR